MLGDFVQQGVTEEDMSMTGAIIVVSTFVAWMLIGDALSRRSRDVERALEGEAVIVVRDGTPDIDRLRVERMTIEDLLGAAREAGYGDLADIRFAVLEHDGKFSFIPS